MADNLKSGTKGIYRDHVPTMTVKDTSGESIEEIKKTIHQHNSSIAQMRSLEETTWEAHDYYRELANQRRKEGEKLEADEFEKKAADALEDFSQAESDRLKLERSKKNWESKLSNLKKKGI